MNTNHYSEKKILITGGLGFIGSNLSRALLAIGAEVTLVDSLIPQYGGNLFNIGDIRDEDTVNVCDVRDPFVMSFLLQDKDYLFNLAGQPAFTPFYREPNIVAEGLCESVLSLPFHQYLEKNDISHVVDSLEEVLVSWAGGEMAGNQ